jgi:hypothetical protein
MLTDVPASAKIQGYGVMPDHTYIACKDLDAARGPSATFDGSGCHRSWSRLGLEIRLSLASCADGLPMRIRAGEIDSFDRIFLLGEAKQGRT